MTFELLAAIVLISLLVGAFLAFEWSNRVWRQELDELLVESDQRVAEANERRLKAERAASQLGVLLLEERARVRSMPDGLKLVRQDGESLG